MGDILRLSVFGGSRICNGFQHTERKYLLYENFVASVIWKFRPESFFKWGV